MSEQKPAGADREATAEAVPPLLPAPTIKPQHAVHRLRYVLPQVPALILQ